MRTPIVLFCVYLAVMLAGCASSVPPSQLEPPAKALMVAPKALPNLKAGDDLVKKHMDVRRMYATEAGKLRRLQLYVKTVRGD